MHSFVAMCCVHQPFLVCVGLYLSISPFQRLLPSLGCPLFPLSFHCVLALPCLQGPFFYRFAHRSSLPDHFWFIPYDNRGRRQRLSLCDMRHMPSQPTYICETSYSPHLPAPFTRCLALAAERLTTRNGCIPNQDPKPAISKPNTHVNLTKIDCKALRQRIHLKGHTCGGCDQPKGRRSSYRRVGSFWGAVDD